MQISIILKALCSKYLTSEVLVQQFLLFLIGGKNAVVIVPCRYEPTTLWLHNLYNDPVRQRSQVCQ